MGDFGDSDWANSGFVAEFLDAVDNKIPQRRRMFELVGSFYKHYLANDPGNAIMDLGCGDGVLTHELLLIDESLTAVLVDGSNDMLDKARRRLGGYDRVSFVRASFEDLVKCNLDMGPFDLVVSSLAIHHLPMAEKRSLFKLIYRSLRPGGYFLNVDTMLPPEELEGWYLELWERWQDANCDDEAQIEEGRELIYGHHQAEEHHACLSTLEDQMAALRGVGFVNNDVVFKDGIFTVYCGKRPTSRPLT